MSLLSDFGNSVLGGITDVLGNIGLAWGTNSAKESLNKNITKTNLKVQKEYDTWTQAQDKAYEQWWQNYLYGLQNNEYYNLARKYAENTASWAVKGLKNAGLNPILAGIDSNLSSSMGSASPQQSGHRVGGGSVHGASVGTSTPKFDIGGVARSLSAHAAARQSQSQADINEIQKEVDSATKYARIDTAISEADRAHLAVTHQANQNQNIEASTASLDARADLDRSNAVLNTVRAANEAKNAGLNGVLGFVSRFVEEMTDDNRDLERYADRTLTGATYRSFGVTGDQFHSARDANRAPVVRVTMPAPSPWYHRPVDELKKKLDHKKD